MFGAVGEHRGVCGQRSRHQVDGVGGVAGEHDGVVVTSPDKGVHGLPGAFVGGGGQLRLVAGSSVHAGVPRQQRFDRLADRAEAGSAGRVVEIDVPPPSAGHQWHVHVGTDQGQVRRPPQSCRHRRVTAHSPPPLRRRRCRRCLCRNRRRTSRRPGPPTTLSAAGSVRAAGTARKGTRAQAASANNGDLMAAVRRKRPNRFAPGPAPYPGTTRRTGLGHACWCVCQLNAGAAGTAGG